MRHSGRPTGPSHRSPTMMRPDPRQHQIALARQTVLAEGMELTEALVGAWLDRAWIVQSWRRCLARGAPPEAPVVFDAVS
ncbi:MAG TPA: hypothetical protein PKH18_08235, partial [Ottowia sp.]|nr:hypothetical protein [Ottowia sp.]